MLVAEVDRLEREVKELGREAQRGVNVDHQLLEIIERDEKRVEEIERDTIKFTQELLEGETRKRFMTAAMKTQSMHLAWCSRWSHRPGAR